MSCDRVRPLLVDLALGSPVSSGVEAHLSACRKCRETAALLRERVSLLDAELATAVAAPGTGFLSRIRGHLDAERAVAAPARWILVPIFGGIVAIGVGLLLVPRRRTLPAPPRVATTLRKKSAGPLIAFDSPPRSGAPQTAVLPVRRAGDNAVLVDRGETSALAELAARLASNRGKLDALAEPARIDLPETQKISIAPIDVPPLDSESPEAATERSSS